MASNTQIIKFTMLLILGAVFFQHTTFADALKSQGMDVVQDASADFKTLAEKEKIIAKQYFLQGIGFDWLNWKAPMESYKKYLKIETSGGGGKNRELTTKSYMQRFSFEQLDTSYKFSNDNKLQIVTIQLSKESDLAKQWEFYEKSLSVAKEVLGEPVRLDPAMAVESLKKKYLNGTISSSMMEWVVAEDGTKMEIGVSKKAVTLKLSNDH